RDFHEDLRQLPALVFTSDKAALAASFEVRKIDSHSFELKPHDTSHYVHKLTLRWDGSLPAALIIEDNLANRTRLQFSSVHINTVVDNSQFQFILPDSADLIDQKGQARP